MNENITSESITNEIRNYIQERKKANKRTAESSVGGGYSPADVTIPPAEDTNVTNKDEDSLLGFRELYDDNISNKAEDTNVTNKDEDSLLGFRELYDDSISNISNKAEDTNTTTEAEDTNVTTKAEDTDVTNKLTEDIDKRANIVKDLEEENSILKTAGKNMITSSAGVGIAATKIARGLLDLAVTIPTDLAEDLGDWVANKEVLDKDKIRQERWDYKVSNFFTNDIIKNLQKVNPEVLGDGSFIDAGLSMLAGAVGGNKTKMLPPMVLDMGKGFLADYLLEYGNSNHSHSSAFGEAWKGAAFGLAGHTVAKAGKATINFFRKDPDKVYEFNSYLLKYAKDTGMDTNVWEHEMRNIPTEDQPYYLMNKLGGTHSDIIIQALNRDKTLKKYFMNEVAERNLRIIRASSVGDVDTQMQVAKNAYQATREILSNTYVPLKNSNTLFDEINLSADEIDSVLNKITDTSENKEFMTNLISKAKLMARKEEVDFSLDEALVLNKAINSIPYELNNANNTIVTNRLRSNLRRIIDTVEEQDKSIHSLVTTTLDTYKNASTNRRLKEVMERMAGATNVKTMVDNSATMNAAKTGGSLNTNDVIAFDYAKLLDNIKKEFGDTYASKELQTTVGVLEDLNKKFGADYKILFSGDVRKLGTNADAGALAVRSAIVAELKNTMWILGKSGNVNKIQKQIAKTIAKSKSVFDFIDTNLKDPEISNGYKQLIYERLTDKDFLKTLDKSKLAKVNSIVKDYESNVSVLDKKIKLKEKSQEVLANSLSDYKLKNNTLLSKLNELEKQSASEFEVRNIYNSNESLSIAEEIDLANAIEKGNADSIRKQTLNVSKKELSRDKLVEATKQKRIKQKERISAKIEANNRAIEKIQAKFDKNADEITEHLKNKKHMEQTKEINLRKTEDFDLKKWLNEFK